MRGAGGLATLLIAVLVAPMAHADFGPLWSDTELSDYSALVLRGHVYSVDSGWDAGSIYTYVGVEVDATIKGQVPYPRIVIKQLGGVLGDIGMYTGGQASFVPGEEVLLFLEVRPRDKTLYTASLWQGKWSVTQRGGARIAVRHAGFSADGEPVGRQERDLGALERGLREHVGTVSRAGSPRAITFLPPEAPEPINTVDAPIVHKIPLLGYSWHEAFMSATVPVNVHRTKQPGVGTGRKQIARAWRGWNEDPASVDVLSKGGRVGGVAPGTSLRDPRGDPTILIQHLDENGEIDNGGGILAIGGAWFSSGTVIRNLKKATNGFIINNDGAGAQAFLSNKNCYTTIVQHELGHVVGLGHSTQRGNLMEPFVSKSECFAGKPLGKDDKKFYKKLYKNAFARESAR